MLAEFGDEAKILAGGQSLVPMLSLRLAFFDHLIDVSRLDKMKGIERRNGALWIGAGTTDATVGASEDVKAAVPLLTRVTPYIGHFQIRSRGTLGGSIAHADPAGEYPAVALALDAEMDAASPTGRRQIAAADFFDGLWETALKPDEVLVGVQFPVWTGRSGFAVEEFARRHGDFAIAGAVVAVELDDDDRVRRCAIGLLGFPRRGGDLRRRRPSPAVRSATRRPTKSATSQWPDSTTFPPTCRGRPRTAPASAPRWCHGLGCLRPRRRSMHERPVQVSVNGQATWATVEPRLTLADYLREKCGLTGTHLGCEHGACGACTVLLDGEAVRSCLIFAVQVDGMEVTTVEAVASPDGELSAVQSALRECHGLQCGFCTPGFVMSITALLRDNPKPTDEEIREGLSGNFCRCTGYQGIVNAVHRAAEMT